MIISFRFLFLFCQAPDMLVVHKIRMNMTSIGGVFFLIEILSFSNFIKDFFFLVGYVTNYNLFPEPLTPEEESDYIEKYQAGDENAKKILIEKNLRLVAHIAKKYSSTYVEQDDIISIGTIGLIKAINSYKGNKGVKLATYAARCIENEILMYFRSTKKLTQEISLNEALRSR